MLELAFERDFPFAPVIVWDALVDPVLVYGWLGDAVIDPVVGGEYNIRWLNRLGNPESLGRITTLQPLERLTIDTTTVGLLRFELTEIDGGNRGTSTRMLLRVDVAVEKAFAARVRADWLTNLDQLAEVLQGHPVDWASWERDHHETWTQHFEASANGAS